MYNFIYVYNFKQVYCKNIIDGHSGDVSLFSP